MLSIKTDDTNDLYLDELGNIVFARDVQALQQVISNNVKLQLGELQYDITRGVPYLETIFGENPDVNLWESYMQDAVEKVNNVIRIESIESTITDNILNYEIIILSTFGEVKING